MLKNGSLFDVYDRVYRVWRCPKIILKTGYDYALSIHYILNVKTQSVPKSIIQLQHYKNTCYNVNTNTSYQIDNRMKKYGTYMREWMYHSVTVLQS